MNVKYAKMSKAVWFQYSDDRDRLQKLIKAIKSNTPVSLADGNDIEIANTQDNVNAVQKFIESESDSSVKTFELKLKNGKTVISNTIGKSPYFGGAGAGGGATGTTAQGECLQCIYCEAMLAEGTKPFAHFTPELLNDYYNASNMDLTFDKIMKVDSQWHESAYVTAKYLIDKKIINKTHAFHRGDKVMKSIYLAKNRSLKAAGMPPLNDDKWNPGDIWAVKKGFNPATILSKTDIMELNQQIKKYFVDKTMIGISLKQIDSLKDRAKHRVYNENGGEVEKMRFTTGEIKAQKSGRATYWSAKAVTLRYNTTTNADLRAGTGFGAPSFEIQGKGARGGKAGWGVIKYACEKYLNTRLRDAKLYKPDATKISRGDKRLVDDLWNKVQVIDRAFRPMNKVTQAEFYDGIGTPKVTPEFVHSLMLGTYVLHAFAKSSSQKRNEAISYIANHAASKVEISSIFIKVMKA